MDNHYFGSGYVTIRGRKIGIVWTGQFAEHLQDNCINDPNGHPWLHQRVQQLAKLVKFWQKGETNTYGGKVKDNKTGLDALVIIEKRSKFVVIKTCYKSN